MSSGSGRPAAAPAPPGACSAQASQLPRPAHPSLRPDTTPGSRRGVTNRPLGLYVVGGRAGDRRPPGPGGSLCSPCSTKPTTTRSARPCATFLAKEVAAAPRAVGEGRHRLREVWRAAGKQGLLGIAVPEEFGGGGDDRLPLQRRPRPRSSRRAGCQRPRLRAAQRRRRAVPDRPGHRGAEAALAARLLQRRAHHRHRDDRARRRLRPAGHRGPRPAADGRPLAAQRLQDLHHQRHHRRPGHRRRARPTPSAGAHGVSLLVVERGMPRLRARPQPRQDRPARPRTPPSCSSTTYACPAENLLGERERRASST